MNQLLIQELASRLDTALKRAYPELIETVHLTPATNEKFGHYQCNSAMKLAKTLGANPREIAERVVEHLDKEGLEGIKVAGPGFINISFGPVFLSQRLDQAFRDPHLGVPRADIGKRIIVEFSSPNIAKEMHVGHLRSTIIGDSLAKLFAFLGADVLRLNHLGDWGTAFGMLIAYMREEVPNVLKGSEQATLSDLMEWYRASKKRFDEDPNFKTKAREAVVELQGGGEEALKGWELICQISRVAYQKVYDLLDVSIEERGESFYNPMLPVVVDDLDKKGVVTLSEGAKCIFLKGFKLPLMVQKSDGGYNYDTTDMAAMLQRVKEEKADRIVIVTDAGQSLHFKLIYAASVKAGYLNPEKVRFDHVPFGLVLGPDGKKFSTRAGETEKLTDLLTAAVTKAKGILEEREHEMGEEEVNELAHALGIGAVKYADLASNRISDYMFSYDRMLRFEGNTAAFILYSYVRVNGIKRKLDIDSIDPMLKSTKIDLKHPSEVSLALHLLRFGEALLQMREDLLPNHLTDYLYALAQKFNAFFRDCQVIGDERQNERLLLCEAVAKTMERGLHLLGLKVAKRM